MYRNVTLEHLEYLCPPDLSGALHPTPYDLYKEDHVMDEHLLRETL